VIERAIPECRGRVLSIAGQHAPTQASYRPGIFAQQLPARYGAEHGVNAPWHSAGNIAKSGPAG